jgi:uncharacterized protein YcbX
MRALRAPPPARDCYPLAVSVGTVVRVPDQSCGGLRVNEWPVVEGGFVADRRWMVVDAAGKFVIQRASMIRSVARRPE